MFQYTMYINDKHCRTLLLIILALFGEVVELCSGRDVYPSETVDGRNIANKFKGCFLESVDRLVRVQVTAHTPRPKLQS